MSEYQYECIECGELNDVDPAVVEFCKEFWDGCDDCGERNVLKLAGKP